MKLGVFVNQYDQGKGILDRLAAEKLGIIFVQNGVYYAALKENGESSPLLEKKAEMYALSEDLQSRGLSETNIDSRVKVVNYGDLVDLIFNDYDKCIWI